MIRLDVVETAHGCKVVEVNSGNCGGMESYFRIFSYASSQLGWKGDIPKLVTTIGNAIDAWGERSVTLTYLDDQSRFLCHARKGILSTLGVQNIRVVHLRDLLNELKCCAEPVAVYRDFLFEELEDWPELRDDAMVVFGGGGFVRSFPSFADEFLSDKALLADVDSCCRNGSAGLFGLSAAAGQNWVNWYAPSYAVRKGRMSPHSTPFDFEGPVVYKPSDGFGGKDVLILDRESLPLNRSFFGDREWVVQRFFEPLRYMRESDSGSDPVNLVHGVFLMPVNGELQYVGTFSRMSPDLVVNIKNDGDVVLFAEPEWQAAPREW
jgi:hypothetical protein